MNTLINILLVLLLGSSLSLNAQNYYLEPDIYEIINSLIEEEYKEVDLVVLDLDRVFKNLGFVDNETGDTIFLLPPLGLYYAYSKELFSDIRKDGLIDSFEAEYMYNEIENSENLLLDSSRINCPTIRKAVITNLIKEKGLNDTYEYLHEHYNANLFLKVSSPLFSSNKNILVISVEVACGRLCGGGGTYVYARKGTKWVLTRRYDNWVS